MVTPSKSAIEAELQQSFLTYDDALAAWYAANPYAPPPAPTTPEEYITQATTPPTGSIQTFPYTAATAPPPPPPSAPPLNLEIAPTPIDSFTQDMILSGPGQLVSGAVRAGEHIIGPVLEPFISPATGYRYERYIYETPTFRAGEAVGTLAIISGGGVMGERAALQRGFTESVFVGEQLIDEPFVLTRGEVSTRQTRYFGLGKKEIARTEVLLRQKAVPITDTTMRVKGLGIAGENILTTKSIVGVSGERFGQVGVAEIIPQTGPRISTRTVGVGRRFDDVVVSAARGDGRIIGRTQIISEAPGTVYGVAGVETATAVDTAVSTKMLKTTTKQMPPAVPPRTKPAAITTKVKPVKQRLRQDVMVTPKQRKIHKQQLAVSIAKVPRQRKMPTSKVMQQQLPKQKPIALTLPKMTPISKQRPKQVPIQREATASRTVVKPIPLDMPMAGRAPAVPSIRAPTSFWPTIVRPSQPRTLRTRPRRKPKRITEYTPSVAAWAANITGRLTRAERKAKFTGFELRPIPTKKRKSKKKTTRRRKK